MQAALFVCFAEVSETRYSQKRVENKCNTKAKLQRHSCRLKPPRYCFLLGFIAQSVDRKLVHWTSPFSVSHKYAISFDNYVLITCSSANIPAELHKVVCPFTRPSSLFSFSNFLMVSGARLIPCRVVLQHFERGNVIEIHNGVMFDAPYTEVKE